MTRDEIISMAREAGFVLADNATDEAVDRFRQLIVLAKEEEREACAEIADEYEYQLVAGSCARDIRARGDACS